MGPLAIEGPPSFTAPASQNMTAEVDVFPNAVEAGAIVPVGEQANSVQVIFFFKLRNKLKEAKPKKKIQCNIYYYYYYYLIGNLGIIYRSNTKRAKGKDLRDYGKFLSVKEK